MKGLWATVVCLAVAACGCANQETRTVEGAAIGGIVGAGAGAIIGHQSKHAGQGALLGGVIGALGGSLVGSQMKKPQQGQSAQSQGQVSQVSESSQQLSIDEIVIMAGEGVSDDVIIDRIRMTGSRFSLTPAQEEALKQKGVSQQVLAAMQGA